MLKANKVVIFLFMTLCLIGVCIAALADNNDRSKMVFAGEAQWLYEAMIKAGQSPRETTGLNLSDPQVHRLAGELLSKYKKSINEGLLFKRIVESYEIENENYICHQDKIIFLGQGGRGPSEYLTGFIEYLAGNYILRNWVFATPLAILYKDFECSKK
jgi:hypothetical protein